jgi:quercetin dioxygenase-like cupin family protein
MVRNAVTRNAVRFVCLSTLALGSVLLAGDQIASAQQQSAIQRKSLLQQDATIPGFQATVNIVEIPAGASETRHTHPGPLTVYILEGTLILEHEGRPNATYQAGEAVLVEAGKIHRGINTGTVPVKLVATLISEKGKPASSPAP